MKVLLTGPTGFIGAEVLSQCLSHPSITSIIAFSRRPLENPIDDPKLELIIMEDFMNYKEDVVQKIKDIDGCIWSLGQKGANYEVEVSYPLAIVNAPLSVSTAKKFRYMHLSGILATADQSKKLWFYGKGRHIKGQAENLVLSFPSKKAGWESYIVKPSVVLPSHASTIHWAINLPLGSVKVNELAACMISIVVHGNDGGEGHGQKFGVARERALENADVVRCGRRVLETSRQELRIREKGKRGGSAERGP